MFCSDRAVRCDHGCRCHVCGGFLGLLVVGLRPCKAENNGDDDDDHDHNTDDDDDDEGNLTVEPVSAQGDIV